MFGGSFDPPHAGHLHAARRAREAFALDHVVYIPAAAPPHKLERPLADGQDRLALLALLLEDEPGVSIWDGELRRAGPSWSVDTARAFARELGAGVELFWILGSDNLPGLAGWREVEEWLRLVQPVIVYRRGAELELEALGGLGGEAQERVRAGLLPGEPFDASASQIRAELERGELPGELLPPRLREYILERGIYRVG
jgi:nicotinate-nucleotide adenylyltransferase